MRSMKIEHLYVGAVFCAVLSFFLYFGLVRAQEVIASVGTYKAASSTEAVLGVEAMQWEQVQYEQNAAILRELRISNDLLTYIARKI